MKRLFILSFITATGLTGLGAQESDLGTFKAVKFYNLTEFSEVRWSRRANDSSDYRYHYLNAEFRVIQPTFGLMWASKSGNFHELELTRLAIGRTQSSTEFRPDSLSSGPIVSGSRTIHSSLVMRYEYIYRLNKESGSKWSFLLGFGVSPYFVQSKFVPQTAVSSLTVDTRVGVRSFITPRLTYNLTSKWFLDINLPLCFFDAHVFTDRDDDPSVSPASRSISVFNFELFPKVLQGRIGIGLRI